VTEIEEQEERVEHLRQAVIDHARWWRDHPGAPGQKLVDALYDLDEAERKLGAMRHREERRARRAS